jgi:hypothetical protein
MRQGMRGLGLLFLVLGAMATAGMASAAALTPTPLTGETLLGVTGTIAGHCNTDGSGNLSFTVVQGLAAGPYPGTFTASGTAVFSKERPATVTISERFEITSVAGHVVGTKSGTFELGVQACSSNTFDVFTVSSLVPYTATITSPLGNGIDTGESEFDVGGTPGVPALGYSETFASFGVLPKPVTKEDCKSGGYQNYPGYSNQGQCIQYVNTGK